MPPAADDLEIFEESPAAAVSFAPRAIRPPTRRGPLVVGAWILGLVSLAGIGLLTEPGDPGVAEPAASAGDGQAAAGLPDRSASPAASATPAASAIDIVELRSPAPAGVDVTTRQLQVEGTLLVRATRLGIALEARGDRVLEQVSVDVSDPNGGIRPERGPTFSATFDLPNPRPNGTMWVIVTAYDDDDLPLGAIRRQFTVGRLVEPHPPPTRGLLVGDPGLVATAAWLGVAAPSIPFCLAEASTLASTC